MARLYGPGPGDPPPLISTTDLAGLRTTDVADRPVGKLYGALSEAASGLIRYLDVELAGALKHVLVPIGHTRIDQEAVQPRVRLRAATYEDLLDVPDYDPDGTDVDGDYHGRLLEAYGRLFYGEFYYAHPAYDHGALYAGESPIVVAPEAEAGGTVSREATSQVKPIAELGRGVRREADLRGLPVDDAGGDRVGEVVDLLVEPAAGRPRYAVLSLEDAARPALVPVGYLTRLESGDGLKTESLTEGDIRLLPPYEPPLTREAENRLLAALEGRLSGERYFHRPDFRRR